MAVVEFRVVGADPDTELLVSFPQGNRTYHRTWKVWGELSGPVQPVPHPTDVATSIVVDIATTRPDPSRDEGPVEPRARTDAARRALRPGHPPALTGQTLAWWPSTS